MTLSVFSDEHFMNEAYKLALMAREEGEIPVGAVIVSSNRIIGKGYNHTEKLNDVTAHAEIIAITAAQNYLGAKYLKDCRMYVTLEPCVMCAGALFWAQIDQLYYGASDEKRGYSMIGPEILHRKTKVSNGLMAEESSDLIREFFKGLRD